jgi:hypothetical protein
MINVLIRAIIGQKPERHNFKFRVSKKRPQRGAGTLRPSGVEMCQLGRLDTTYS